MNKEELIKKLLDYSEDLFNFISKVAPDSDYFNDFADRGDKLSEEVRKTLKE